MSTTVALTGATGFIGTALRTALADAGYQVRALTRIPRAPDRGIIWIQGDIASASALSELVQAADAVIHCAGIVRGAAREEFDRVNVGGTAVLLDAMRQHAPRSRLLFISTLAARAPDLSWYSASKAGAEALIRDRSDLSWTIFRPTAVYGPGDREMRPLFEWLLRGVLLTPQPADARFSLLHVEDLASAVLYWLRQGGTAGMTYELSDGTAGGYDIPMFARLVEQRLGHRPIVIRVPRWLLGMLSHLNLAAARVMGRAPMLTPGKVRELAHPDWSADPGRFMQATGWSPRLRFQDVLASNSLFFT